MKSFNDQYHYVRHIIKMTIKPFLLKIIQFIVSDDKLKQNAISFLNRYPMLKERLRKAWHIYLYNQQNKVASTFTYNMLTPKAKEVYELFIAEKLI